MKISIDELEGPLLDYAVGKWMLLDLYFDNEGYLWCKNENHPFGEDYRYNPSSNWNQCGPILEQHSIRLARDTKTSRWVASHINPSSNRTLLNIADRPTLAISRCFLNMCTNPHGWTGVQVEIFDEVIAQFKGKL